MIKQEIRKKYKDKRLALTDKEFRQYQDLMLIFFQQLSLPFVHYVHYYQPVARLREPDPENIIRWLNFKNPDMICASPKIEPDSGDMHSYIVNEETEFTVNSFGVYEPYNAQEIEPVNFDLIIIPLLAFDKDGFRVGYGKGYYDRFLIRCRPDVIKVGLSFFDPVDQIDDNNTFDQQLDYCITPTGYYEF